MSVVCDLKEVRASDGYEQLDGWGGKGSRLV
jgi:hypothetical protein